MLPRPNSRLSAVTSVRPNTCAVATRNRSAGSPCASGSSSDARAISWVSGASRIGAVARNSHDLISEGNCSRRLRLSSNASHVLMGESHSSFSGLRNSERTRFPRRRESCKLHIQIWVSSRSFNGAVPPTQIRRWREKQCRPEFLSRPSSSRSSPIAWRPDSGARLRLQVFQSGSRELASWSFAPHREYPGT